MWLYTKLGWIKANRILFYGFFNKQAFADYNELPRVSQYDNLALLTYNPNKKLIEPTYREKQKAVNKIIH